MIMAMIYARRARLRRPLQPGRHLRLRADAATSPGALVLAYWAAQFAGAIAAAAVLLRGSLGDIADVGATSPVGLGRAERSSGSSCSRSS